MWNESKFTGVHYLCERILKYPVKGVSCASLWCSVVDKQNVV